MQPYRRGIQVALLTLWTAGATSAAGMNRSRTPPPRDSGPTLCDFSNMFPGRGPRG